jgi:hypothetical protein
MLTDRADNVIRLSIFITGVAHFTLPEKARTGNKTLDEFWLVGGTAGSNILSLDTEGVGHDVDFPTDLPTIAFQTPLSKVPPHSVLHRGACRFDTGSASQIGGS